MKSDEEVFIVLPDGVTTCPNCLKRVPESKHCLYCGYKLQKTKRKKLTDLETIILETLSNGEPTVPVKKIFTEVVDSSKEVIRVYLSQLVKRGLISNPSRGQYKITETGKEMYKHS